MTFAVVQKTRHHRLPDNRESIFRMVEPADSVARNSGAASADGIAIGGASRVASVKRGPASRPRSSRRLTSPVLGVLASQRRSSRTSALPSSIETGTVTPATAIDLSATQHLSEQTDVVRGPTVRPATPPLVRSSVAPERCLAPGTRGRRRCRGGGRSCGRSAHRR